MLSSPAAADSASPELLAIEQRLSTIWSATLRAGEVRSTDHFLELGGDSMMMMIVLSRVRDELGVSLDQGALFQFPVLRDFSAMVLQQQASAKGAAPTPSGLRSEQGAI